MEDENSVDLAKPMWFLINESLRSNNERVHGPALNVCQCLGPFFQPLLINELWLGKPTPKHRARLLQAIGRTGPIAQPADVASLFVALMRDKHPEVREQAAELLYNMPEQQRQVSAGRSPSEASCLGQ